MATTVGLTNVRFMFVVCSIVANGEEVGMLQNDIHHKEGKEDLSVVQLLPVREHGREREGGVTSSGDNFNELLRGTSVGITWGNKRLLTSDVRVYICLFLNCIYCLTSLHFPRL